MSDPGNRKDASDVGYEEGRTTELFLWGTLPGKLTRETVEQEAPSRYTIKMIKEAL